MCVYVCGGVVGQESGSPWQVGGGEGYVCMWGGCRGVGVGVTMAGGRG